MGFFSKFAGGFANSLGSSVLSGVASLISANSNRKWNEKMMDKQNEFNAEQAQLTRDYNQQVDSTKYQRQVSDMQAAGVNPALAMNGGVTTQASSNATASSAGVQNGNMDLSSVAQMAMQAKQLDIQAALAKSQERKNNADARREEINNEYLSDFNQLRNAGMDITNSLGESQKQEIVARVRNLDETFKLIGAQVKTETEKAMLTAAETELQRSLKNKTEQEIVNLATLLPFQKSLMSAQTESAKANAAAQFAKAAIDNGLIDEGYVKSVAAKAAADAGLADAERFASDYANAVKSGDTSKIASLVGTGDDTRGQALTKSIVGGINILGSVVGNFFNGVGVNVGYSSVRQGVNLNTKSKMEYIKPSRNVPRRDVNYMFH